MADLSLTDLAITIHAQNKAKGWHEEDHHSAVYHMLVVTELAEATECARNAEPDHYLDAKGKPCGEAVEIADALIRILDYCGYRKWDVDEIVKEKLAFNKTRPHRHGGKTF